MNIRNLSDNDLAEIGKNIEARLAAHELKCFDDALADMLAAEFVPVNTAFEAAIEECVAINNTKVAKFQAKRDERAREVERVATIQRYLASVNADKVYYDLCGLPYKKSGSRVDPEAPTALCATGVSNGSNEMKWTGNNRSGSVTYEIWRRVGDAADWNFLKITRKQFEVDAPVVPGQYYQYRVRAVAASGDVSVWSNTAIVYGAP